MMQKVNDKKDLSSRQFPFPIDSCDLKVSTSNLMRMYLVGIYS